MAEPNERFAARLSQLRMQKGVSARDMSLSLGQSAGYINNIENRNNLPSMTQFFYICDYLNVAPRDFFDYDTPAPEDLARLCGALRRLSSSQLAHVEALVDDILA